MTSLRNGVLVVAPAGEWQVAAIFAAQAMGIKVLAVDSSASCAGREHADFFVQLEDFSDHRPLLQFAEINALNIKGALSFCSDAGQVLCASLRRTLNLHGDSTQVAIAFVNKAVQRELNAGCSWQPPIWNVAHSLAESKRFLKRQEGVFVAKPVDSSGSRGVSIIGPTMTDLDELLGAAFSASKTQTILLESFAVGEEFTVDGFVWERIAHVFLVTKKTRSTANPAVAIGLVTVPEDKAEFASLSTLAQDVISNLGKVSGPFHLEAILDSSGSPTLIEISARGGGFGLSTDLIPATRGPDFVTMCVLDALGVRPENESLLCSRQLHGRIHFFGPSEGTVLEELHQSRLKLRPEFVVRKYAVKDKPRCTMSDGDRLGSLTYVGDDNRYLEMSNDSFVQSAKQPSERS